MQSITPIKLFVQLSRLMKNKRLSLQIYALIALFFLPYNSVAQVYSSDDENTLLITTDYGTSVIRLSPHIAPNHVKRIKTLVRQGHYKDAVFHRVISGLIAQIGSSATDHSGTGEKIRAEFSNHPHKRGTVSMARHEGKHSADDQFFIVLGNSPHLDRNYTIFGHVIAGMEFIDLLPSGDENNGALDTPIPIKGLWVAADAAKAHSKEIERRKALKKQQQQKAWDERFEAADPNNF